MRETAAIILQTDFGLESGKAAALTGEIMKVDRRLDVFSSQHCLSKGDVRSASCMLYSLLPFWPEQSVFISLVQSRKSTDSPRAIAVLTNNQRQILTWDDGSVTLVEREFGIRELRALDLGGFASPIAAFAYYAARLSKGALTFSRLGEPLDPASMVYYKEREAVVKAGEVSCGIGMILPNFGNLTLNVKIEDFEQSGIHLGESAIVRLSQNDLPLFRQEVRYERSFGFVAKGEPVLFNGSSGFMGLALNQDHFIHRYMPSILADDADYTDYLIHIKKGENV